MIKKILAIAAVVGLLISCGGNSVRSDNDFDVSVTEPQLMESKPGVLFDEAHNNHHSIKTSYKPFANLISNDGCIVSSTDNSVDSSLLSNVDVFIIATAKGKEDPNDKSPFSVSEVDQLEHWVANGGSLLLITEHFPFGMAMKPIFDKINVQVHNGYTEDTLLRSENVIDAIQFAKSKGNLHPSHPILNNIEKINTFTGTSIKGDSTWTQLILFSDNSQNFNVKVDVIKDGRDVVTNVTYSDFYSAKDYAQGLCKHYGKGRIAILAESGFITAQYDRSGNKFGMNVPDQDNKQFVLNLIRWLAGSPVK